MTTPQTPAEPPRIGVLVGEILEIDRGFREQDVEARLGAPRLAGMRRKQRLGAVQGSHRRLVGLARHSPCSALGQRRSRPNAAWVFLIIPSSHPPAPVARSLSGPAALADCVIPKIQKKAQSAGGQGVFPYRSFTVTDGSQQLKVVSRDDPPSTVREGQGVVVEGHLGADGVFDGDQVIVRHSNEYQPPGEAAQ